MIYKKEWFKYKDIDDDDVTLEINFNMLNAKIFATLYNYNGEVKSRNKVIGWWSATNKKKFFNMLRNNIGNMSEETRKEYLEFITELEDKYKECDNK